MSKGYICTWRVSPQTLIESISFRHILVLLRSKQWSRCWSSSKLLLPNMKPGSDMEQPNGQGSSESQ